MNPKIRVQVSAGPHFCFFYNRSKSFLFSCRERDFLKKIHECMERDGKVSTTTLQLPKHIHFIVTMDIGFDTCLCIGKSPGTVHLAGDILVSRTAAAFLRKMNALFAPSGTG